MRRAFPPPVWQVHGYASNGQPAYVGRSRLLYTLSYHLMRMLPRRLGALYFFFIRKPDST